jgi:hypothetical protein
MRCYLRTPLAAEHASIERGVVNLVGTPIPPVHVHRIARLPGLPAALVATRLGSSRVARLEGGVRGIVSVCLDLRTDGLGRCWTR